MRSSDARDKTEGQLALPFADIGRENVIIRADDAEGNDQERPYAEWQASESADDDSTRQRCLDATAGVFLVDPVISA